MAERYMNKDEARAFLASIGIALNDRQMRRAIENRRLPFFPNPITGRLVITESAIRETFARAAESALEPAAPHAPQKPAGKKRAASGAPKGGRGVNTGSVTFRQRYGVEWRAARDVPVHQGDGGPGVRLRKDAPQPGLGEG
ncbi:hypothetical protein [Azospirillum sp. TSO22-1]|uniref:hypothetical protein n=1 Tax=Azospirillum sp. TSO22-1 TaxID=716789 RepID=UPI000D619079|nr:hypothetical protein [Azospirillum sp. TSO22-1]PWC53623.1 hypothetical protein TSO221_10370 [Azospirillum sp. TSO22-1]